MKELLNIENICVKYGRIEALRNLSLSINEGDFIGIIGPNGGGKSTLLKTILGIKKPFKGTIEYTGTTQKKTKLRMGYVPQISEINTQFPITVKESVLTSKLPQKPTFLYKYTQKDNDEVMEILKSVDIDHLANRQIDELSGGEFQKMLIARALATNPDILLLDEPTAMVDNKSQRQIYNIIKKLSKDKTILIVTHHIKDITKQAHKLIWLNRNVLAQGDPEEVYKYAYERPTSSRGREVKSHV